MLFYIPPKIISSLIENSNNKKIIEAIDNLAFSRRNGYHLLTAEYSDLKFLKKFEKLERKTLSVFSNLFQTWSEIGNFKNQFKTYVEIVLAPDVLKIKKENGTKIIYLSIDYIQNFDLLNKTKILAENQGEIDFYIFISNLYKNKNGFKHISLNYNLLMGGGDTTAPVFKTEITQKQSFCLCFADKDIEYPNCKIGSTLKKIEIENEKSTPLCELLAIDVNEIENLIPLKLLKKACLDTNHKKGYEFVEKMKEADLDEYIKYLDFKKGISLKKFVELKNIKYLQFLKEIIIKTDLLSETNFDEYRKFIETELNNSFKKIKEKKSKNEHIVDFFNNTNLIYGMGDKLLNRIINGNLNDEIIKESDLLQFQLKEWIKIGEYITFWTCGGSHLVSS